MSKRVLNNIDIGLWVEYGHPADDYTAAVGQHFDFWGDYYYLSFHKGRMPAFTTRTFDTLEDLVSAMREIEPDLRKWRICKPE